MDAQARHAVREIRDLLWEWDFLGVGFARASIDDEYDCLEWPLYEQLKRGVPTGQIATYLDAELRSHFGITPPPSVALFIEKLVSWWGSMEAPADRPRQSASDEIAALRRFEESEDRWWLEGYVPSESLPDVATDGLVAGLDSPSLRILAGNRPADLDENRRLFGDALREMGRVPPVEDPLMRTAWRIVEAIIENRMDPCRGAHKLYWMASVPVEDPVQIELPQRLEAFAILADECEQLPLNERSEIRQKVVDAARELQASFGFRKETHE